MARLARLIRDRLITNRNVPHTLYGMQSLFFNGGSHGYVFTFTLGNGP